MLDKAVITRAEDFGSSHSANQAIYEVSKKGIVKNKTIFDLPFRYAPFDLKKLNIFKRIM